MANRPNHKKKHYLRLQKTDFTVPLDNVLDLKKILSEKKKEEEKEKKFSFKVKSGLFSRSRKASFKAKKETSFLAPEKNFSPTSSFLEKKKVLANPFKNINRKSIKALTIFMIVSAILILPIYIFASYQKADDLKGKVLGASTQAYDHLKLASEAFADFNLSLASSEFDSALGYFQEAQTMFSQVSGMLKLVPVKGGEVSAAEKLLKAGEAISTAGQYVTRAFTPFVSPDTRKDEINPSSPFGLSSELMLANNNLKPAISELERANYYLQRVTLKSLPEQYQSKFLSIKENIPNLITSLEKVIQFSDLLLPILGHDSTKRYLFVFQNNAELRPTGGFIGSFALVTLEKGVMKELEIPGGGSYDLNGWLKERVIAPKPLHLVNPHWYFQDANWFPDFPTSAEKLIWFFNESGGPSVDGVIALTPDVIESLLALTGPIEAKEEYGEIISQNNIRKIIQEETESLKETSAPKRIIATLTPHLFNKIGELDYLKQLEALSILNTLLKEKQLLFYFTDPELEKAVVAREWAGEIKETSQDYLSVINTNISGGKTDLEVEELIGYELNIQADGKAQAEVTVTRIHKGEAGDSSSGIKNIDFMRFYLPKGSKLLSASGFEIMDPRKFLYPNEGYQEDEDLKEIEGKVVIDEASGMRINNEFNKTVFGNWVGTEPGKSSQVSITYELPFKIKPTGLFSKSTPYSLLVQKQPGTKGSVLKTKITFPLELKVLWQYPEEESFKITEGEANFNTNLITDTYLGFVLKK